MTLLGALPRTVTRYGAVTYIAGVATRGAVETFTVVGTLLPLTAREIQDLPPLQRKTARWKLFVEASEPILHTVVVKDKLTADRVNGMRIEGEKDFSHIPGFELIHHQYWLTEPEQPDVPVTGDGTGDC